MICQFPDCGRRVVSRGLCDPHRIQRRTGKTLRPVGSYVPTTPSLAERFWPKVDKNGPLHSEHGACWIWNGARGTKRGVPRYGNLCVAPGKWTHAHKASWLLHGGADPGELFVLHRCDNPICVNPAHLFLGTHSDNMRDMLRKGRGRWRSDSAPIRSG